MKLEPATEMEDFEEVRWTVLCVHRGRLETTAGEVERAQHWTWPTASRQEALGGSSQEGVLAQTQEKPRRREGSTSSRWPVDQCKAKLVEKCSTDYEASRQEAADELQVRESLEDSALGGRYAQRPSGSKSLSRQSRVRSRGVAAPGDEHKTSCSGDGGGDSTIPTSVRQT